MIPGIAPENPGAGENSRSDIGDTGERQRIGSEVHHGPHHQPRSHTSVERRKLSFCVDTQPTGHGSEPAGEYPQKRPGKVTGRTQERRFYCFGFPVATHRQDTRGKRRELKHAGNHRHKSTVYHRYQGTTPGTAVPMRVRLFEIRRSRVTSGEEHHPVYPAIGGQGTQGEEPERGRSPPGSLVQTPTGWLKPTFRTQCDAMSCKTVIWRLTTNHAMSIFYNNLCKIATN